MYDAEHARIYDFLYSAAGKDYGAEVTALAELVRELTPDTSSLLDVACGTGEHLRSLRGQFDRLAGVELSSAMAGVAREKFDDVPIHEGDMRDFDLGERFDVVLCMFSSIGYVGDVASLDRAIVAMARHLESGGTLIVESSFRDDQWREGHLTSMSAKTDDRAVARVSRSSRRGDVAVFDMHFLIGDSGGVRHVNERHELSMFTRGQYEAAFESADLSVHYLESEPFARGLYIGTPWR